MKKSLMFVLVLTVLCTSLVTAAEYSVVVPQLSPSSTELYKNIIVAIIEATGNKANVQVLPFARFVYMMETKQADVGSSIVAIPDRQKWTDLKYDYSQTELVKMAFVLYANKNKPIDPAELKKGNPKKYKIETDAAHVNHFSFTPLPSTSIEASLKKVDAGTIDGYLFAQPSTDAMLKNLSLKNIVRRYYDVLPAVFVLQKGSRNGALDKLITDGMAKIKANGTYDEMMGQYVKAASVYNDWQP